MNSVQGAQPNLLATRVLTVRFAAVATTTLLMFPLHDWYHSDFTSFLGISNRLADTIGMLGVLVFFIGLQRFISVFFFKDAHFGLQTTLTDPRPHCPALPTRYASASPFPNSRK